MNGYSVSRRLPIVFHPLDLERKTKAIPCVICPVRRDLIALGGCAFCPEFSRIEFDERGQPQLTCLVRRGNVGAARRPDRVIDAMRLPLICVGAQTPLSAVRDYLALGCASDLVVVLDMRAVPVGYLNIAQLRIAFAAMSAEELDQVTFERVMDPNLICATPEMLLAEARQLLAEQSAPRLFIVSADGTFVGTYNRADPPHITH